MGLTDVMSPRVALVPSTFAMPTQVTISGGKVAMQDGKPQPSLAVPGGYLITEYRQLKSSLIAMMLVAPATLPGSIPGSLAILWVPQAATPAGDVAQQYHDMFNAPEFKAVTAAWWPINLGPDRTMLIAALEADPSPNAVAALAAWPAGWRMRTGTEKAGDPAIPTAPGAPNGPRCIGVTLA